MRNFYIRSKFAMITLAIIMFSLLLLTIVTYWQFNQVIETELIDTMSVRTRESANHINTWLAGQLGEVRETVNSPMIDRVLSVNPQLDLTRDDESIKLIDELNLARWKYVASAYPNQYAALHIISYLEPNAWDNPEKLATLTARYYNVKDGTCKTDLWAKAVADEARERYSKTAGAYDAIFKPAYSQAYGRNMVLMLAWRKDNQGRVLAGAAASLTIETIQQIAQHANYGKKGYEVLLAQDGTFVTHPNLSWAMTEKTSSVSDENMQKLGGLITSGQSGVFRYIEKGEKKIAFYNPIPVAGWTLVSVVDENELFVPANKLLVLMVAIIAIIMIFTLMAVYIVSLIVNLKRSHADREELKTRNIELNGTKERLRLQNIELEIAQKHLLNLDQMKDEFLAKVSHELKTPLHGIIGLAECTRDALLSLSDIESKNNFELIIKSGARLANLVDEIATFSTLKNNQVRLNKVPICLHDVVQMIITLEKFSVNHNVELKNLVSLDLPPIYADSEKLMQILHNLIRNAIKFTDAGLVSVSAHLQADHIVISVNDTGIGIPESRLNLIFNPFEQGDSQNGKRYGGLGLGLAISKSLLELHNSVLSVVSKPGEGSCFSFSLPQWHGDHHTEKNMSMNVLLPSQIQSIVPTLINEYNQTEYPKEQQPGTKKILIVDDEEVNLAVAKSCFYGMNCRVVCVKSGEAALTEIMKNDYHLVLLDMMMPGLNGIEVCREIRKHFSENTLPIIMITVRNRPEDIELSFMAKANDYIAKPFHKKELLARVQAQLRSQEVYETEHRIYQAEISALQSQIQPHFLYNTLNTIIALCRMNPIKAAELLEELSNYLQNKFRFNSMDLIPLEQELDLIKSYLAIEQVRFGKRLHIIFGIETNSNPLIPPLILQPLVENAVKHGVYPKREGGTIQILIKNDGQDTLIVVTDDGVGMTSDKVEYLLNGKKAQEIGIGLENIHKRLQKHYGYGLDIQSDINKGTTITVKIPTTRGEEID
ncbi:ATP-binding protein [Pelosinus sp. sgz500959]|uniref:ATP-binding protein n=1 Tax=Pelosinus sp. sgz500959 TaxID=3242472 RepID=UPI00366EF182